MENELQMQSDNLPNRMSLVNDGIPPQSLSEFLLRSSFPQPGTQNESLVGFPPTLSCSSSQGDPFKDHLHADKTVIYDGSLPRDNSNFHELCLGSSSLPLAQEVPSESLGEMFSSNCSYASSSSVPTSLNCGYDGILSNANGTKWYQNRFLMQMENQDNVNQWMLSNTAYNISSSLPYETSISHNELSLSLATCEAPPLACSQGNRDLSLVEFGPNSSRAPHFSHEMISGSRYLTALQQILSELASFSLEGVDHTSYSSGFAGSSSNAIVPLNQFNGPRVSFKGANEFCGDDGSFEAPAESSNRRQEVEAKKSQLLGLLELVDECYSRCLDEMHTVISAFHAATELDPQLHSCFTLRTISYFYKNLRERLSNEILVIGIDGRSRRDVNSVGSFEKSFIQKQWALQQLKRKNQHLWRPQRGLPERSVSILRAWMFENFLHPYPKDSEKHLLALKSGLTRSQVSNWFINARVRIWKPLVEEMCSELNRRKGASRQNNEGTSDNNNRMRSHLSIYEHNQRFNT